MGKGQTHIPQNVFQRNTLFMVLDREKTSLCISLEKPKSQNVYMLTEPAPLHKTTVPL